MSVETRYLGKIDSLHVEEIRVFRSSGMNLMNLDTHSSLVDLYINILHALHFICAK